jgi:hypothetical protein
MFTYADQIAVRDCTTLCTALFGAGIAVLLAFVI